jgi:hypothetical protein
MAGGARDRQAGDGHRLASPRLPTILDVEEPPPQGSTDRSGGVRALIRTMSEANHLWGAPRIHGELLKLGIDIGETSVSKYMARHPKPPSQTWRTFLENHVKDLVSVDFFTVPTIRFQVLYVFLVLAHDRRRIVHVNVTAHPTAEWTAQQLRDAFPWNTVPRPFCVIATAFSARRSARMYKPWVSRRCYLHRTRPGNGRTSNG